MLKCKKKKNTGKITIIGEIVFYFLLGEHYIPHGGFSYT